MAKHQRGQADDEGPTSTAKVNDNYIGRHRDRTEVREDAGGWAVGRGVNPQDVIDHTRND